MAATSLPRLAARDGRVDSFSVDTPAGWTPRLPGTQGPGTGLLYALQTRVLAHGAAVSPVGTLRVLR